jgi:hypothetical protein
MKKLHEVQNQIVQSDYKINIIEMMLRKETFSMKLDQTINKLNEMSGLEDTFVPEIDRIKYIEKSVHTIDDKLNTCLDESKKLDATLNKLDVLNAKTSLLKPEIDRIKVIENSVEIAEKKLNKCLNESVKLDETLVRLDALNEKMSSFEPEFSKINSIELSMDKFDQKQTKLITILLEAINKRRSSETTPVTTPVTTPKLQRKEMKSSSDFEMYAPQLKSSDKIQQIYSSLVPEKIDPDSQELDSVESKPEMKSRLIADDSDDATEAKQSVFDLKISTGVKEKIKVFGENSKTKLPVLIAKDKKDRDDKDDKDDKEKKESKKESGNPDWSKLFKKK